MEQPLPEVKWVGVMHEGVPCRRKDLDAFRARLKQLGIKYDQIDGVVASDQVFVKDPSGFTWEFQEKK